MTSLVNVVKGFSYVNDFCDPCFWHMTDADIVSAMVKWSDNKEEESGYNITVVRKIWTAIKRDQNNYQKQTLWSA